MKKDTLSLDAINTAEMDEEEIERILKEIEADEEDISRFTGEADYSEPLGSFGEFWKKDRNSEPSKPRRKKAS